MQLVRPLTDLALFSIGIVGNLLLIIFLSLFIVVDQDRILAYINRLVPPRYAEPARLFEKSVSTSFGGFIRGQAIQGLRYGGFAAITMLVFGLDFLPASAALVGVIQMVPFFGPLLSWAPPVVVAMLTRPEVAMLGADRHAHRLVHREQHRGAARDVAGGWHPPHRRPDIGDHRPQGRGHRRRDLCPAVRRGDRRRSSTTSWGLAPTSRAM